MFEVKVSPLFALYQLIIFTIQCKSDSESPTPLVLPPRPKSAHIPLSLSLQDANLQLTEVAGGFLLPPEPYISKDIAFADHFGGVYGQNGDALNHSRRFDPSTGWWSTDDPVVLKASKLSEAK